MPAATSFLIAAGVASAAVGFGGSVLESNAIKAEGDFQKKMFDSNAQLARLQADDTLDRGEKTATDYKKGVKKLIGSQRASLAAQGIEVDSGSALDVQTDTATLGELDALTIKNNAWREAWGYRVQAMQATTRGQYAYDASRTKARNTLLVGGANAITSLLSTATKLGGK